jgi:hypothetical protein
MGDDTLVLLGPGLGKVIQIFIQNLIQTHAARAVAFHPVHPHPVAHQSVIEGAQHI